MMKKRNSEKIGIGRLIIFSLVFLLSFASFSAVAHADARQDLPLEMLETPTGISDLLARFSRLEYSMTLENVDGESDEIIMEYSYLGPETVRGRDADRVSFALMVDDEMLPVEFWVSEGELLQMEIEGEVIPLQFIGFLAEEMIESIFMPFFMFEDLDVYDEDVLISDVENFDYRLGELDVIMYEFTVEDVEGEGSGTMRLAAYEDFLLIAGYDITAEEGIFKFALEEIELR